MVQDQQEQAHLGASRTKEKPTQQMQATMQGPPVQVDLEVLGEVIPDRREAKK